VLEPTRMLEVDKFRKVLRQLWAEAKAVYEAGELDYYDLSQQVRDVVQDNYQAEDPLEESVMEFLVEWQGDKFRMNDLLRYLNMGDSVRNRALTGQLKDILVRVGCEHKKSMRVCTGGTGPGYVINRELIPQGSTSTKY